MATYKRIKCAKPQGTGSANRITLTWIGPDKIERTYTVNQSTLNGFNTAAQAKTALDNFTQANFGYTLTDLWLHKNRSGTWAIATGASAPAVWPEDQT